MKSFLLFAIGLGLIFYFGSQVLMTGSVFNAAIKFVQFLIGG